MIYVRSVAVLAIITASIMLATVQVTHPIKYSSGTPVGVEAGLAKPGD
jgi:hypothetical protein